MAKKEMNKLAWFLVPIGVAVNFIGGTIILLLKLPIYLDSIGTIIVGALCGAWPGVIVGLISNILTAITSPNNLFYAPLNMAFGVFAAYLSKKGVFKKFIPTLLSSLGFAFIGGVIGALITWSLWGFDFGAGTTAIVVLPLWKALGSPENQVTKFFIQVLGEFSCDLLDKAVTVIVCYFILKAFPTRFLSKLPLGPVYISDEEKALEEE
ncbi:MAG: ECF transporter S component [Erysipelotrichaceae bacterium]|nr:ECF transporter S component [Erysipelotrichaceae bacterium]MBQ6492336.1 ECF transporter S component [Erysipelotrichaceae bacterium]